MLLVAVTPITNVYVTPIFASVASGKVNTAPSASEKTKVVPDSETVILSSAAFLIIFFFPVIDPVTFNVPPNDTAPVPVVNVLSPSIVTSPYQ